MIKRLDKTMMQETIRHSLAAATAPAWILFAVILFSAVAPDIAQAKGNTAAAAMACGKQLKAQCIGVRVEGNNMLECLKKNEQNLSASCVALANNVVRRCDRDAARLCQGNVAGNGNIIECLTIAKRSVSSRCNAAIDAARLRQ
jgi:hypothetical protein